MYGSGHAQVYKNFVAALNGIEPLLVTGEEAIKSLKLLHAIYVSTEESREVQLSDAPVSQLGLTFLPKKASHLDDKVIKIT